MLKDLVKPLLSDRARSRIARWRVDARRPSACLRRLPDFLVIGGMRCGTSSLYRYLGSHPSITPSVRKEVEYFSRSWWRGEGWYRAHFPLKPIFPRGKRRIAFEATPYYLLHPHAPARAAACVAAAKLIVMLREPVERAFSHHQHMVRHGMEELPFEDAVREEPARTDKEWERLVRDPDHDSLPVHRYSYVRRGEYTEQLTRWFDCFSRESFCIVFFEEFFANPESEYGRILEFLGVADRTPGEFRNYSYVSTAQSAVARKNVASHGISKRLRSHFRAHNARLAELLGRALPW